MSIKSFAIFDYRSPLLTPFNFHHHQGLPPTYIQVCGLDPWRDTGKIYGEELEQEGVAVRADVYPGLPHCWYTTFPTLKVSEKWMDDTLEGVRWLLKLERKKEESSKL